MSEKGSSDEHREPNSAYTPLRLLHRVSALLAHYGVETHGYVCPFVFDSLEYPSDTNGSIAPIPVAERVETRWYQMFFVWFSANMNVLAYVIWRTIIRIWGKKKVILYLWQLRHRNRRTRIFFVGCSRFHRDHRCDRPRVRNSRLCLGLLLIREDIRFCLFPAFL